MAHMAARAFRDVERLNDWLDFSLDLVEKLLDFLRIGAGELVLDNEPSNRIEIDARTWKPSREPSTSVVPPPMKQSSTLRSLKFSAF